MGPVVDVVGRKIKKIYMKSACTEIVLQIINRVYYMIRLDILDLKRVIN
jgi:hypothetical protein